MDDILLVEDTATDAELVEYVFRRNRLGNRIHVVTNGKDALDFLFCRERFANRQDEPLPTIILLDLKLPRMNGIEVLKEIKANEKTRQIPVIALTSSTEDKDLRCCYELGVNSYVQKPIEFTEFMKSVAQMGHYWLVLNRPAI